MECDPLQNIVKDEGLNTPQKAKKVLDELRFLRYPEWKSAERRFREKLDLLTLPTGTRVDHPPFFEAQGASPVNFAWASEISGPILS